MILMRAIRLNFLSILFSTNVIWASYRFEEVFYFEPAGPPHSDFGIDTTFYTQERRDQECANGSLFLTDVIGLNDLTGMEAGPTLLYVTQTFENDPWDTITGFRCYATRDFLVQEKEDEEDTILIVLGGPSQPPLPPTPPEEPDQPEEPVEPEQPEQPVEEEHNDPAENSDVEYEGPYPGPYNGYH